MTKDPICGMDVNESTSLTAQRDGQTFSFYSSHCRTGFIADRRRSGPVPQASYIVLSRVSKTYVCPMCEGIESDLPGTCPQCGMALERVKPIVCPVHTVYTCPMHPELEQDEPGVCPKCGMPLEPRVIQSATEEDDTELRVMRRRL